MAGGYRFYSAEPMYTKVKIDGAGSSYIASNLTLVYGVNGVDGNAQFTVQNGGVLSVKNTLLINSNTANMVAAGLPTNNFTLNNGTLVMGGVGSTNNGLFEVQGLLRGKGSIQAGAGNAGRTYAPAARFVPATSPTPLPQACCP